LESIVVPSKTRPPLAPTLISHLLDHEVIHHPSVFLSNSKYSSVLSLKEYVDLFCSRLPLPQRFPSRSSRCQYPFWGPPSPVYIPPSAWKTVKSLSFCSALPRSTPKGPSRFFLTLEPPVPAKFLMWFFWDCGLF